MSTKRKSYSAKFKAKLVLEVLEGIRQSMRVQVCMRYCRLVSKTGDNIFELFDNITKINHSPPLLDSIFILHYAIFFKRESL